MTNDICGIDFKRRSSRGATGDGGVVGEVYFKRRSATRDGGRTVNRGLKPTATITGSLRDQRHVELADLNQEAVGLAKTIQKNFEGLGV
jgi:hypothetical protein